jgi:diacylglycerol kinase (ATP)
MGILHVIGNRESPEALAEWARMGCAVVQLHAADSAGTRVAIRRAVEQDRATRVVVIGGDGMVHQAVNALSMLEETVRPMLGVVPLGSGNDFARAMQLPVDDPVAAARIAAGPSRAIDLLQTNYGCVATVATCGFPARVNKRANSLRRPKGPSKYTVATLLELPRLRPDRLEIRIDQQPPITVDSTLLAIGNTAWFGGGMQVCPSAQPDDQRADVLWTSALSRLALLRFLPTIFSGAHLRNRRTFTASGTVVELTSFRSGVELWGDGEYLGPLPCRVEVIPNALRLACPLG